MITNRESYNIRDDRRGAFKPLGLYIHIPFCAAKCRYCDFTSFPGVSAENKAKYFRALCNEIEAWDEVLGDEFRADTIFIGGGTPTAAGVDLITELMGTIRGSGIGAGVGDGGDVESTVEANPGTVDIGMLRKLRGSGINRISVGVQSFDDSVLKLMGRIHTGEEAEAAVRDARAAGFKNINLDLMFGVPGQTLSGWKETLKRAVDLGPAHISFYSLQIEEGTPFYEDFKKGVLDQIPDELNREMYHHASEMLRENGYVHYEISNAAKAGFECAHNLRYWSMGDYLGAGLGAHSFINGRRFFNSSDPHEYGKVFGGRGALEVSRIYSESHENSLEDSIVEYMITGLRKLEGIKTSDFRERFGCGFYDIYGETAERFERDGLLIIEDEDPGDPRTGDKIIRFTVKGIDISNSVLSEFIL